MSEEASSDQTLGEAPLQQGFERLYTDLRRLAAQRLAQLGPGQTLTPTVLVHEAYEKLVAAQHLEIHDRQHFFACAAQAMRQIVIDHIRQARSARRGGHWQRTQLGEHTQPAMDHAQMLDLDLALTRLGAIDAELLQLVELRWFAGMTLDEIAALSGRARRTLDRQWQRAQLLLRGLTQKPDPV